MPDRSATTPTHRDDSETSVTSWTGGPGRLGLRRKDMAHHRPVYRMPRTRSHRL